MVETTTIPRLQLKGGRMIFRHIAVVLLAFGLLSWPAGAAEPTRVALVTSGESSAADAVIDLAMVALSQQESVVLLERKAVSDALAEQELSLAGSQGADSAIQVGKLLATDVFAVVEVEAIGSRGRRSGDEQVPAPVGLVVFDARTGTRLWDQALPPSDAEELSKTVSTGVMSAVGKARSDSADRKAVCLVTVRNAELPRSFDSYRPAMAALLQRQLARQPALELLERRHLEHFNRERNLAAEAVGRELTGSAILIAVDLTRADKTNAVRAVAVLTDSAGRRLGTATAQVDEPDVLSLTERLAESLVRELGQTFAGSLANPRLEARRFRMESNSAVIHERFADAIPAGEAAFALVPDDIELAADLANTLARGSRNLVFTKQTSPTRRKLEPATDAEIILAIDWVSRSLAIRRQFYAAARSSGDVERIDADGRQFAHLGWAFPAESAIETIMRRYRYVTPDEPPSAVVGTALRRLKAEWLAWQTEIADAGAPLAAARERAHRMLMFDDPGACIALEAAWLMKWYQQTRDNLDESATSPRDCTYTARTLGGGWLEPTPQQCEPLFEAYATIQADDSHVMFPFMGLQGRAYLCRLSGQPVSQDMIDDAQALRRQVLEHGGRLVGLGSKARIADKQLAYEAFFEIIRWPWTGESPAERLEAGMTGYRSMLDQGVATSTMVIPLEMMLAAEEEHWPELYRLVQDLEKRHREKQFRTKFYWSSVATRVGKIRATILKRYPDLDPSRRPREWNSTQQLVDVKDVPGVDYVIIPMLVKDRLLCLGVTRGTSPCRVNLIEAPLSGDGSPRVVNETTFTTRFITYRGQGLKNIRGVCRTSDAVFVATAESGVARLPFDGSPPTWITTDSGLLSNYTHAIAMLNDRLIVASGDLGADGFVLGKEMYLQSLDLEAGTHKVIVSTRRKDRQSPFDDGPLFDVNAIVADPERDRLLLMIQIEHRPGRSGGDPKTGFWEYSPKTGFRQLAHLVGHLREGFADSFPDGVQSDRMWLTDRGGIMGMNLKDDTLDWAYRTNQTVWTRSIRNRIETQVRYKGPFVLTDDALWTFEPLGRFDIRSRKYTRFATPADPERLRFNHRFERWTAFLRVLPNREQMLYVDGKSIWLLEIPPNSAD